MRRCRNTLTIILLILLLPVLMMAGTTGKIAGTVKDADTGEPLIGANVALQGTYLGASTDTDGFYAVQNIPPGTYTVVVTYVGYGRTIVQDVVVKIDLTTKLDVEMNSAMVEGEEVIVQAERPLVQRDLTSTSVTVSADELKRIPTENIGQVVNIQAGVVGGHFRGGRSNEVAYLIDGVAVNDPYNNQRSIEIDNSSIREMEVISGTFNAEYGQAMSGVVNIVTQEGSRDLHGSVSAYAGDFITAHTDVFDNIGSLSEMRTRNLQLMLTGPIPIIEGLSFYATGRYLFEGGHLYGRRIYNTTDPSPIQLRDPLGNPILDANGDPAYLTPHSGDSAFVAMNTGRRRSANGKITYSRENLKISYGIFWDDNWNKYYDHSFRWVPDGITNHYRTSTIHTLQTTYMLSNDTYTSLKFGYNKFEYEGYLYEDPYDARYVDPYQGSPISNYTYRSGGNHGGRYDRYSETFIGQWQLNSQITTRHKIGLGIEGRKHNIYAHGMDIMNRNTVETDSSGALIFEIGYPNPGTLGNQDYFKQPYEVSAYIQDKMEYDIMIINAGVRFDYFDPRSSYPLDLRNPSGNTLFPNANTFKKAKAKLQVSPRFGISFPITDEGIIHFSYGHFFQIPSFENLYVNSDYLVTPGSSLSSILGNPDLEAQRTVMYELGLQQVLFGVIGLDFSVYSRDIRNLLGMEIINTYEGFRYARFINRDYGNIKGFILSLEKRFQDFYSVRFDYTYQLAEGNASDPYAEYQNNQSDPPVETNKKVVPLNWDQRSTLSLSLTVGEPGDWTVGTIMQYGTGFPYTEDIRVSNGLRFENGGRRPSTFNVDLRADKSISFAGIQVSVFALVYNLLDTKNEVNVDAASGRANIDLFTYQAGRLIGLNTIDEYVNNPANFSAPRQIRIGMSLNF